MLVREVIPGAPFRGTASILCSCDTTLREDGVVAVGTLDQEAVVSGEVDTDWLKEIRVRGEVTPLNDRRWDVIEALYCETGTFHAESKLIRKANSAAVEEITAPIVLAHSCCVSMAKPVSRRGAALRHFTSGHAAAPKSRGLSLNAPFAALWSTS